MKIENGKIVEATKVELFDYYLKRGFDEIYSFPDYCERCELYGTKIVDKEGSEEQTNE